MDVERFVMVESVRIGRLCGTRGGVAISVMTALKSLNRGVKSLALLLLPLLPLLLLVVVVLAV